MLIWALIIRSIKKYFDNAQPKAKVDKVEHQTKYRLEREVDGRNKRIRFSYHFIGGKSDHVIHFFHGFGSDEEAWYAPGLFASKEWLAVDDLLDDDPNIIVISFDKSWMISNEKDRRRGQREATVDNIEYILYHLEAKLMPDGVDKRIAVGVSMGGHNAAMMWLHRPGMWDGCILHNPMLKDWDEKKKMPVDLIVKGEFKKGEFVYQAPNAMEGLKKATPEHPPIQIQVAKHDEFGFFKPGKDYCKELQELGVPASLVINSAGHHDLEDVYAADFINNITNETPKEKKDEVSVPDVD